MKLVTVSEMQAIEREADASGHTYEQMMEYAGRNLAHAIADAYGDLKEEGVLGLVGSGNNGGDALVALAALADQGWIANAYLVRPRSEDDQLLQRLETAGGKIYRTETPGVFDLLGTLLEKHAVLVDGVLGTGIRLPLKPEVAQALAYVGARIADMDDPPRVVAVDCPSGIDLDTGETAPEAIPADLTVTMAAIKSGMLKFPAFNLLGELQVVGIGLPENGETLEAWRSVRCFVPDGDWVRAALPSRPADSHKGTFGTALVAAGSANYTGAALLAGMAAYRIGAGLVTLAVPAPLHAALAGHFPEATWLLLPHEMGVIDAKAADVMLENLERATALLAGPGFGMEDTTQEFLDNLLGASPRHARGNIGFVRKAAQAADTPRKASLPPLVIDADGLKLLARLDGWPGRLPPHSVLTPHPGEMAVLTGLSKDKIQADRLGTAQRFAEQWGHIVVLKGAFTVIAAPDGQAAIIPVATAALARAGTGDVLAGLITGLRAQGVKPFPAAVAGAWIHAQAGLYAAAAMGNTASVLAGDVLEAAIEVLSDLLD